jgi:peroxiredoxin
MTSSGRIAGAFFFLSVLSFIHAGDGLQTGSRAPEFRLPLAGGPGEAGLADFSGRKTVILHFWKSKWNECRAEFPHLATIQKDYADRGVQILSINPIDQKGKVESDARRYTLPYPVLVGRDSRIVEQYKISGLPRLVVIGPDGKVVFYAKFAKADAIKALLDGMPKWPLRNARRTGFQRRVRFPA